MQPVLVENYPHVMIYEVAEQRYFYQVGPTITPLSLEQKFDFLLKDKNLEEIMYNGPTTPLKVFHKKYGLCETNIMIDEQSASTYIQQIVQSNHKYLDEQTPMFDGSLPDGSRINITIPPASIGGSTITIRKFTRKIVNILDLIDSDVINPEAAAFLWCVVEGLGFKAANIIVAGGTGSGKTTTLNAMVMFIPSNARIVTIEDTMELRLMHSNVVRMIANEEAGITMDHLLTNSLRMRPDRILVGEVRGQEAVTLFSAMNTGHQGSMGTLHANDARHCITRITEPPMGVPPNLISALDLIVMQEKVSSMAGHFRRISEITEISGAEEGNVRFNVLYKFDQAKNKLLNTGIPSKLRTTISQAAGIPIKEFDKEVARRAKVLEKLVKKKSGTEELLKAVEKSRF